MVPPAYLMLAAVGESILPTLHATIAISLLPFAVHSSVSTSLSVRSLTQMLGMLAGITPTGTRWFNLSFITKLPLPPLHGWPTGNLKVGPSMLSFFFFSLLFSSCFFSLSQILLDSLMAFVTALLWLAIAPVALVKAVATALHFKPYFANASLLRSTSFLYEITDLRSPS